MGGAQDMVGVRHAEAGVAGRQTVQAETFGPPLSRALSKRSSMSPSASTLAACEAWISAPLPERGVEAVIDGAVLGEGHPAAGVAG